MNTKKRNRIVSEGFVLIELLAVIGICVLIGGVVIASINASKDKARDADTRKTISEVALKIEEQEFAPGAIDYQSAFTAVGGPSVIAGLAAKLNLSAGEYEYDVTSSDYAIVFPLRKGGYYCIDSLGHATGKEVIGLFETTGPKNCNTATRIAAGPQDGGGGDAGAGGDGGGGAIIEEEIIGGGGGGGDGKIVCEYAAPPQGCTMIPGPDFVPETNCGLVLDCVGEEDQPAP